MSRRWEAVPYVGILFFLALGGEDGAERFCGLQPGHHVGQEARETCVILWEQLGRRGEVFFKTTDRTRCARLSAQRESVAAVTCGDLIATDCRKSKTSL